MSSTSAHWLLLAVQVEACPGTTSRPPDSAATKGVCQPVGSQRLQDEAIRRPTSGVTRGGTSAGAMNAYPASSSSGTVTATMAAGVGTPPS